MINKYIFSDLPESILINCITDTDYLVTKKEWAKSLSAPRFQTDPVLFDKEDLHWQIIKNTFIQSVFSFTQKKIKLVTCWAYISLPNEWSYYDDKSWHNHTEENEEKVSGIFYLKTPAGCRGTEFKIGNNITEVIPEQKTWFIYNSELYHRPGRWNHSMMFQPRYVLAADAWLV